MVDYLAGLGLRETSPLGNLRVEVQNDLRAELQSKIGDMLPGQQF